MAIKNPKELFVLMLSNVRQASERAGKIYQEIAQVAQDPDVKEALEARAFVSNNSLRTLDEVFKLIGEKPVNTSGRLQDLFIEDFRKELAEIQSPEARHLFILSKALHLNHLRIGEYIALVAAADLSGHHGAGVLLESCLANKLAFSERTRRFLRHRIENKLAAKMAA
jgi:ferritin-like metal-binding protein YciE